eukprot:XP_003726514.1 PREDICTED: uncharacterized protein LOC589781 isoform X3 [Strongylocentrotus purpuratus]
MECCGSCFPRSKKSFKTSGIPAEPPSHTKAPSVNRAPPSNGSTTTHSNGAPPSPSNSFSSTSFSSTHSGGEAPRATGQRTLEITLPAGTTITSTVDAKLQMMDLLVMIAAKNKLNPTGHVILPATADRTDIAQFKASQRIGELDTTILQIVPKLSRGEIISIRTSDKKKAAQFEQTVRLTVLSGKNHKALFRVNPEKPIQDFLPQVYEERGIEANECRLRLVKTPEEDIDYSKSLNHYGGVNELVLIDLRPPPPQEPELVPIEKKKKSMFGRKSKKKGEGEPLSLTPTKEAAPPEPSQAPPAARQPSLDSTEGTDNNTLKKRRPAPPPPGGKKEPTHDEQLLKPSMEGVSRSAQGVSKKRRAPAPPPAGSAPPIPLVDPIPEVTVNHGSESPSLSDQGRHISFGATEVIESPLSTPTSTPADTPADTPESTLERRKKDGGDATATGDDIQVEVSLAELDEVLDEDIPPPPDYAPPPPPVFDPPPPPDEPPSPGEPQEDVDRLIQEGRLVLSPGVGLEDNDTTSECSSDHDLASSLCASATSSLIKSMEDAFEEALAVGRESLTNDATAEQEVSVSQVNIASIDQSVPEDPESGEKVRIDSTNQDEDTTEASTDETQANISEQTADDNKADTTTDIKEKRAALTKMMKLSLDEDSKETTSYSPTPQGEDSESMLEEKSLTALAGGVTREAVGDQTLQVNKDKTKDTVEESLSLEKEKEEETVEEKEKEKKEGEEKTNVEEKKDVEVHEVTKQQDEIAKAEQPNMEQLAEQYKQLQQQMAMLQQQLVLNPTSASAPMQMNPAMAYQTQQMQQMQQQMILQQQMFMQQQQQAMGGYVMVPQPGGGNVMVPGQPGGGMMMSPPQMMYTPMGVQPLPAYGQVTPPQVVATPAVDQQDSPAKSVADETDSGVKEEPKETSRDQPDEVTHQETPLKPPTDAQATASGRRNVFADILKKKNAPKSSYVLSAQREAQRQRSDSNSSLTSSTSSKEGTAAAALSVETPKLELRTETSPTRHDSPVTNGLSPTSSEPSVSSVEDPPTSPPIATSLSNNFSLNISNNNTSKTMTLNAETSQPEATKDTPTSPPPAAPISSQGSRKVPPAIRPKPQKGPRPFRPASTYGKVSAPENEEGYSSSHVRKVTDLRSMFMLGK